MELLKQEAQIEAQIQSQKINENQMTSTSNTQKATSIWSNFTRDNERVDHSAQVALWKAKVLSLFFVIR